MERDIAQETLAAIDSDQDQMARRTVMPSWYHAAVAVCCAAFVGSAAVPDDTRAVAFPFVAVAWVAANALVAWGSVWWVVVPTLLAAAFGWWMSLTSQRRFARRLRDGR